MSIQGVERRRSRRIPLLETFSLFVVVPSKGSHKLPAYDVSREGLSFAYDLEEESPDDSPLNQGEIIDIYFYFNQSLYIPLKVKVVQVKNDLDQRQVGALIQNQASKNYKGYLAFVQLFEGLIDVFKIEATTFL
jgi:hypothetical protein